MLHSKMLSCCTEVHQIWTHFGKMDAGAPCFYLILQVSLLSWRSYHSHCKGIMGKLGRETAAIMD